MSPTLVRSVTILSFLGGGALLIAPKTTGALFGLPTESTLFLRALGVRDIVIGGVLLSGAHREGLIARGLSDAFDSALIVREGLRGRRSVASALLRAVVGATSSVVAISAALSREPEVATDAPSA